MHNKFRCTSSLLLAPLSGQGVGGRYAYNGERWGGWCIVQGGRQAGRQAGLAQIAPKDGEAGASLSLQSAAAAAAVCTKRG